jgi:hypothetical protein
MEPKTGKRIVSKGEYVLRRAFQGGLAFSCACAIGVALMTGFAAIIALICEIATIVYALQHHHLLEESTDVVKCLVWVFVLGGVSWLSWRVASATAKKSTENLVVPLTRANTADLPAPDSLVRASSEPLQAQEAVLLRATAEGMETPLEQLVRASMRME